MIQLKDITKDYVTSSNVVKALRGVNLAFRENEFVAILGPSGGGKTTLLNIVGGLDKYTSGDLVINGKSTVKFSDREWDSYRNHSVGFIFQSYNLIPHQSVLSNVELALTISQVSKAEKKQRAIDALTSVGLADQIYKKPNQLSGGQMQRVAIARALVNNPDIILADEPTGALDTESSVAVMDLLKQVARDRLVVMVTHNPDLADQYANRIIRLRDGQIVSDSNPYNPQEMVDDFRYGKTNMNFFTALGLSLNNLLTKKARTLLTAFAGSIGIIGIALILSLSTGVNKYIDDVQANSLSSYPLTIEKQTSDMSSMMSGMAMEIKGTKREEGSIAETMVASEMFANVNTNDLKGFKEYIDENKEEFSKYLTSVKYSYGLTLNIYKTDTSDGIIQLNPSTLMTQIYGEYSSYISSYISTFTEMIDDQDILKDQYDVIAGKWADSFDECMLVVYDRYTITDFMSYQIGLRNPDDFGALIKAAMAGQASQLKDEGKSYSYDDVLKMTYSVVLGADCYKYNADFNIWEDMSGDEAYMKQVIEDALKLKIVGIICPSDRTSSSSLNPGIVYNSSLMTHMVNEARNREIVIKQLEDEETDIISGKSFTELNSNAMGNGESSTDFSSMITVDSNKLSKAFNISLDQKLINNTINDVMNGSLKDGYSEVSETGSKIVSALPDLLEGFYNYYIDNYGTFDIAIYDTAKVNRAIDEYMQTAEAKQILQPVADSTGISYQQTVEYTSDLLKIVLEEYYNYCLDNGLQFAVISRDQVPAMVIALLSNEKVSLAVSDYFNKMMDKKIQKVTRNLIKDIQPKLTKVLASSLKIDGDMIASAFQFNMDEAQMERVISGLMASGRKINSQSSNLRSFGYGDMSDPENINLYFSNFEAKDAFKEIIDQYNQQMEDTDHKEKVIAYTDITGILMSSITDIIDAISYVLIAFVSVSLIVSSIMIAIITYISVLERTKEIGILRALGASKKDVKRVFNAETFIIGLVSGAIGIIMTLILIIPINKIIRHLTNIKNIGAVLPSRAACILILISVVLTIVAGLIPSSMASKCDPVTALRSE